MTLKQLRTERGLTQEQCAWQAGVTSRQYINWEKSVSVMPADKFKLLADFFCINLEELFSACFCED